MVAGTRLRTEGWEGEGWQRCKFQIEGMQASLMGWLGGAVRQKRKMCRSHEFFQSGFLPDSDCAQNKSRSPNAC